MGRPSKLHKKQVTEERKKRHGPVCHLCVATNETISRLCKDTIPSQRKLKDCECMDCHATKMMFAAWATGSLLSSPFVLHRIHNAETCPVHMQLFILTFRTLSRQRFGPDIIPPKLDHDPMIIYTFIRNMYLLNLTAEFTGFLPFGFQRLRLSCSWY